MGYYTQYSLEVRNIKKNEVEDLDNELNTRGLINYVFYDKYYDEAYKQLEYSSYEEQKWYDCEKDMIEISKKFPDAIFQLSGEGEEWGDLWRRYFANGIVEYCDGQIVYETPKSIEWDSLIQI